MMNRESLIIKLLAHIYTDQDDKTLVRLNVDNILHVLVSNGPYILPFREFEEKLEKIVTEHAPKDLPANTTGKRLIAEAIIKLADAMHITKEDIQRYNNKLEKEWRETMREIDELDKSPESLKFRTDVDARTLRSYVKTDKPDQ